MTGSVSCSTSTLNWFLAIICCVTTKWALINSAVWVAVKRHAHVLQVIHNLGRFTAHELNRVLVTEPIGAFDRVVKVLVPVVFRHIAQRGANTALRRYRV